MGQEEYQEISSFLKRFSRRFKLLRGVEGICLTAICAVLLFATGLGIYQLRQLLPYAPLAYSILTGIVLLVAIGWTAVSLSRPVYRKNGRRCISNSSSPSCATISSTRCNSIPRSLRRRILPVSRRPWCLRSCARPSSRSASLKIDELLDHSRLRSSARLLAFLHRAGVGGGISQSLRGGRDIEYVGQSARPSAAESDNYRS